jgi:glycosyltransferase involved in cell wall biosynthesis
MKIAFVSLMRAFPWGGSEELWYRAAKLALLGGHSVCTLTQKWSKVPEKLQQLQRLGAETVFYDAVQYTAVQKMAIKLKAKRYVPDTVPELHADLYVVSNGSTWDFLYNQHITERIIGRNKPYCMISQHNFENGHIVKDAQRDYAVQVLSQATGLFFVSERNKKSAERQLGYFLQQARIINNPTNIDNKQIKPFPASDTLLMACVARLDCEFKGQDILLQVLGSNQWAERDFQLKLYGAGPHAHHLQQLIELYQLPHKVSIEGHVHNVDAIWETNQVLVLPSLSEGTPLALMEAMLSGRAAVTTDVGDNGEYVLDGQTGFLVATASEKCLASSLEALWNSKDHLEDLGKAAFAHASQITDFNPEERLWGFIQQIQP